jgi:hypothetical protein
MQGLDINNEELKGLIPRMNEEIFSYFERSPDYLDF